MAHMNSTFCLSVGMTASLVEKSCRSLNRNIDGWDECEAYLKSGFLCERMNVLRRENHGAVIACEEVSRLALYHVWDCFHCVDGLRIVSLKFRGCFASASRQCAELWSHQCLGEIQGRWLRICSSLHGSLLEVAAATRAYGQMNCLVRNRELPLHPYYSANMLTSP